MDEFILSPGIYRALNGSAMELTEPVLDSPVMGEIWWAKRRGGKRWLVTPEGLKAAGYEKEN